MKHYNRRDFLKALGIGVTVAAVAPFVVRAGTRIQLDITGKVPPVRFPWEFWGETELTTAPGLAGIEHARLYALQASAPPDGFRFFVHYLRLGVREDVSLQDLQTFMGTWNISLHSGTRELMEAPAYLLLQSGLFGSGQTTIYPELEITKEALTLSAHGKPFPLTGPPITIQCGVIGVGQQSPSQYSGHGGRPETPDQQDGPRVAKQEGAS